MSGHDADVIIVGAGIVGAACAAAVAKRGLSVILIESRHVSSGATACGMGHLVVMDDSPAQIALTRYSVELWNELAPSLGLEVELDRCGTIWVAADEQEMQEVHRKHAVYAEQGVTSEVLDAGQIAQAEPMLRQGLAGGLHVAGDSVIYPPTAAMWLVERAKRDGARVILGKVVSLRGGAVTLEDETKLSSLFTVNAAGAVARVLTPSADVRPRKGHLAITDRYPGLVRHQLIELGYLNSAHGSSADSVAFNIQPRKTGQLLIGSSRQYGSDSAEIEMDILKRMIDRAVEYMPTIARLHLVRAWTGFRPSTPDKLPLIGPTVADPRLLLATGHEGLGITTSLATGELIAAQITNQASGIAIDPYLPARYEREVAIA